MYLQEKISGFHHLPIVLQPFTITSQLIREREHLKLKEKLFTPQIYLKQKHVICISILIHHRKVSTLFFYRQRFFLSQPRYTYDFSNFSLTLSLLSAKNNRICCLDHDQFTALEGPTPVYHSKNSETTIQLSSLNNEGSYNLQAVVLPAQFEFVESFHFSEKI